MPLDRDTVLAAFDQDNNRLLRAKDIITKLSVHADDRRALRQLLRVLVEEGDLLQHPGRRYSLAGDGQLVEGVVRLHPKGYGWLLPDDDAVKDAFIPPPDCDGLMSQDRVLCRILPSEKGPVAHVVKVLARGKTTITGVLRRYKNAVYVEADGMRDALLIPDGIEGNADGIEDAMVVEVLIVQHPTTVTSPIGRVVRALGKEGDITVEIERLIAEGGIVRPFSPETLEEAAQLPDAPREHDLRGRRDLRDVALCTIDGETAKDFDDAVFAERDKNGIRVIVAIADVAHYVRPGTALDQDAVSRGTSVYYPGRCIPMLPEALSNGLCSLVPHQDRLCMGVEFRVTDKGAIQKPKFFNGVLKSQARLTYTLAQKYFDGDKDARDEIPKPVQMSLDALLVAARALRKRRFRRGALDFDMTERVVQIDDNTSEPVAIQPHERAEAHRVIEDLMIATNEAVAEHFEGLDRPCIYRIHETPDPEKLDRFMTLVKKVVPGRFTTPKGQVPEPRQLRDVRAKIGEHRLKSALDFLLLRAMQQARYSTDNVGHYGLASDAYAHFTSPIRRYPDLMVHRELKSLLAGQSFKTEQQKEGREEALEEIAGSCSQLERRAVDVERAISALYAAWFMKDRIGEEFEGTVSGCAEFGVFVRFDQPDVEGMAHISTLGGDYFRYDPVMMRLYGERSGFAVGIGDRCLVKVQSVDLERRQVLVELLMVTERDGEEVELEPPPAFSEGGVRRTGRRRKEKPTSQKPRKGGRRRRR